jgi:hypothetical protein
VPSDHDLHRVADITGNAVETGAKIVVSVLKVGPKIGQAIADALKRDGLLTDKTTTGLHVRNHIKGCSGRTHSGRHIRKHLFG